MLRELFPTFFMTKKELKEHNQLLIELSKSKAEQRNLELKKDIAKMEKSLNKNKPGLRIIRRTPIQKVQKSDLFGLSQE